MHRGSIRQTEKKVWLTIIVEYNRLYFVTRPFDNEGNIGKRCVCAFCSKVSYCASAEAPGGSSGSVGHACRCSLSGDGFVQHREPLCCNRRRGWPVVQRFVWMNASRGVLWSSDDQLLLSVFCLQMGRCTPGERGLADASAEKRRILGYRRQCSLTRATLSRWHRWLVVMATLYWQWNVIFPLLFFVKQFEMSGRGEIEQSSFRR